MTPAGAASRLGAAGFDFDPNDIRIERRTDCFVATLPRQRMAWFPANERGRAHLDIERRVLGLIAARCTFRVPVVLFTDEEGWDLRGLVPGQVDPFGYAAQLKADPALQVQLSQYLAMAIAEQHTRIRSIDVKDWLPRNPPWPPSRDIVADKLPAVIKDAALLGRVTSAVDAYYDLDVAEHERALVHGDLGFHNMAIDPGSRLPNGIFDYGDAAWADRHHDFRYLTFGAIHDTLLDATMQAYMAATDLELSRSRILLYNAACAIGHLANRAGSEPTACVSGRTLAQDLAWTRWALQRGGFS